jgi:hypothetical protein
VVGGFAFLVSKDYNYIGQVHQLRAVVRTAEAVVNTLVLVKGNLGLF